MRWLGLLLLLGSLVVVPATAQTLGHGMPGVPETPEEHVEKLAEYRSKAKSGNPSDVLAWGSFLLRVLVEGLHETDQVDVQADVEPAIEALFEVAKGDSPQADEAHRLLALILYALKRDEEAVFMAKEALAAKVDGTMLAFALRDSDASERDALCADVLPRARAALPPTRPPAGGTHIQANMDWRFDADMDANARPKP